MRGGMNSNFLEDFIVISFFNTINITIVHI